MSGGNSLSVRDSTRSTFDLIRPNCAVTSKLRSALARMISESGWQDVAWRNLTFGVVALHHAIRAG